MLASPLCSLAVLVLVAVSHREARATRRLWRVAEPLLAGGATPPAPAPPLLGDASRARVAALNEATLELRGGLRQAGVVPRACAKAALSVGALGALLDGAALLGGDAMIALAPVLGLSAGCVGAASCLWLGRAAEREARRLRSAWDTLIRRSARDVRT